MLHDKAHIEPDSPTAGLRMAAGVTAVGALLLVASATDLWFGSGVVATSLAAAMLVFGGYHLVFRGPLDRRARRHAALAAFEGPF